MMFYFQSNRNLIIIVLLAFILYYLYWSNIIKSMETTGKINNSIFQDGPNINVVDLNKPLLPNQTYGNIRCRLSTEIYVKVTLCIHDIVNDKCKSFLIKFLQS